MRPFFTIVLLVLITGFGHLALAKGGTAADPIEKKEQKCSRPHEARPHELHLPEQKCRLQQAAAKEKGDANVSVQEHNQKASKTSAASITAEKTIKEVSEPKKESTNLTFNFLYYIFYKFSVSDFFQAPSYN